MPSDIIYFQILAEYFSEIYHVDVNFSWLLTVFLLCPILAIALPPIPGATLTCYGILIAQLGIPSEALMLAATVDVIEDFIATGFNVMLLQMETAYQASKLGQINKDLLYASAKIPEK